MSLGNICFLKHKRFKCTGALKLATLQRPSVVVGWARAREAEVEMYGFYQSHLYWRVTKKYDIYRNNNKKNLVTLAKVRLLAQKIFFMKQIFFIP